MRKSLTRLSIAGMSILVIVLIFNACTKIDSSARNQKEVFDVSAAKE